eukprot:547216-Rhodomonas_salina.2
MMSLAFRVFRALWNLNRAPGPARRTASLSGGVPACLALAVTLPGASLSLPVSASQPEASRST